MPKKNISFEEALAELETIIENLDGPDLTLEQALAYFEKGVGLIRECDQQLKRADGKLRELLAGEQGEYIEKVIGVNLQSMRGGEAIDG